MSPDVLVNVFRDEQLGLDVVAPQGLMRMQAEICMTIRHLCTGNTKSFTIFRVQIGDGRIHQYIYIYIYHNWHLIVAESIPNIIWCKMLFILDHVIRSMPHRHTHIMYFLQFSFLCYVALLPNIFKSVCQIFTIHFATEWACPQYIDRFWQWHNRVQ